ncbi:MAG: hypothetical protein OEU36_19550 [Gammaproteobacteria bacterium]|nr:hypothetical protein [Gammaproteobacteria bacterium]
MTLVVMRPTSALSGWQKKTGMSSKIETKDSSYIHSYHLDTIRFWLSGCALRDALREIDVAAYDGANNQFVVALPESTEKQALLAVNRLNDIIGDRIATQLYIGVAEFPEDGLIMEDLIKHAMDPTNRELGAHNQAKDREPATRQKPSLLIPERERVGT